MSTDSAVHDDPAGNLIWSRPDEPYIPAEQKLTARSLGARLLEAAQAFVEDHAGILGLRHEQVAQLGESARRNGKPFRLAKDAGKTLVWLPLPRNDEVDGSFIVERDAGGVDAPDRTAVLLAACFARDDQGRARLVPRQGIRVVAQLRGTGNALVIEIGSATVSLDRAPASGSRSGLLRAPRQGPPAMRALKESIKTQEIPVQAVIADPVSRRGLAQGEAYRLPFEQPSVICGIVESAGLKLMSNRSKLGLALRQPDLIEVLGADDALGVPPRQDVVRTVAPVGPAAASPSGVPAAARLSPKVWAATAFLHTASLFDALAHWGLNAKSLLRFVNFPVKVRYLAQVNGAHGNAQACWVNDQALAQPSLRRLPIELRYGYAPGASMSLACDPRWQWHEFGHLLLGGTTGNLELPFAHSVGDALSAIRHDPDSELARPTTHDPYARERGRSFPWVCTDAERPFDGPYVRFHARCVGQGWGWNGFRIAGSIDDTPRRYRAEQVLSTTLFLVYRALGGDRVDAHGDIDREGRREAAAYCMYLIVRALALLGPEAVVPAQGPRDLMTALIDADMGDSKFFGRPRGNARKAIVWAFGVMGLEGPASSSTVGAPAVPAVVEFSKEEHIWSGVGRCDELAGY